MGNLLLQTDSYKHSHFKQYPPGTKFVSSYIEARGAVESGPLIFFGIQAFIEDYLAKPITAQDIFEAKRVLKLHGLPFNEEGWNYILNQHGGYLPLEIQALPEGTLVNRGVPVVQVCNTDSETPWLTSFIETALLRAIWYATSVATLSFATKLSLMNAMNISSDDPEAGLPFKLHDFGARGVSSAESAAIGGMAHLVNFSGTDTLEGIMKVRQTYSDGESYMPGFSIPASEHSTMTSWGCANEEAAYANMIDQFGNGLFSVVSDSYNLMKAVRDIFGDKLKDKIEAIEGKLIVRPDSGDPVTTPLMVLDVLWEKFGGTVNKKGYKVLNSKVAVIQGDGMNFETINTLSTALLLKGFSLDNIAFGMGGGLLQDHMRDDLSFAMKANAVDTGNGWEEVQKKPATDPAKASKAGRQAVVMNDGVLEAISEARLSEANSVPDQPKIKNHLATVWNDSGYITPPFEDVRKRAHAEAVSYLNSMYATSGGEPFLMAGEYAKKA